MHPQFQATKADLIDLLGNLDVYIDSSTRLAVRDLEEKLAESLDRCQAIRDIPQLIGDTGFVGVDSFPEYVLEAGKGMLDEVRRHTIGEALDNSLRDQLGIDPHLRPGQQAFYDLRQTLMHLGHHYEVGRKQFVVKDEADSTAICIRILEIRKVAPETPLFLVLYHHDLKDHWPIRSIDWVQELVASGTVPTINATVSEQHLLLRLLDRNAQRVSPSLRRKRKSTENSFVLSFLLPVAPLSSNARDVMSVEAPETCAVCGKQTIFYCGGCRAIRYCGPEHAKQSWKSHKPVCRNLSGAEWLRLPFNTKRGPSAIIINHNSVLQGSNTTRPSTMQPSDGPPPKFYGSGPFLIKLQLPRLFTAGGPALIYDQPRAFQITLMREDCPTSVWTKIYEACDANGFQGIKLYVWARRTAEYELSVAIDRLPDQKKISW